jgi:uncharacterized protein YjbJ (UPF0337 family)
MSNAIHSKSHSRPTLKERIAGKARRAVGELTGRPDLVIEGEAQDTGLPPEDQVHPAVEAAKKPDGTG